MGKRNVKVSRGVKIFFPVFKILIKFSLSFLGRYLKSSVTSCNGDAHAKVLREKFRHDSVFYYFHLGNAAAYEKELKNLIQYAASHRAEVGHLRAMRRTCTTRETAGRKNSPRNSDIRGVNVQFSRKTPHSKSVLGRAAPRCVHLC